MNQAKQMPLANRRWLSSAIWVAQLLVAVPFLAIASMKLRWPIDQLRVAVPWAGEYPIMVRWMGAIDLAGGLGLVLPALTRIRPRLTIWAALGCALLMVCAIIFHSARGEIGATPINFVFLGLSGLICWGRSKAAPIAER